jgi:hypothetical protein
MEQSIDKQFDLSSGIIFEFSKGTGLPDPGIEKPSNFSGVHDWLKAMILAKSDYNIYSFCETIKSDSIQILDNNFVAKQIDATHQGLIQYMFHAWAKELGVVLKPDMFFFTIVSEIKNQILKNPDEYKNLFTESENKEQITLINLTIDKLMVALEHRIPCKELFNLITKTSFSTEPIHFKQVMGIIMADMCTPYYDYSCMACGIPKIVVLGSRIDWEKLITTISSLQTIFKSCEVLSSYFSGLLTTVIQLITAVFVNKDANFFDNMFIYYKNPQCGSGHARIVMEGWVRKFYIQDKYLRYINDFPSHLNCLPHDIKDLDGFTIDYYFYVAGMCSSRIVNGYLYPEYNIAHCKILHPDKKVIFDILAANKE